MARVQIPSQAKPLLRFCDRNHPHEENSCFATNADLVMFAAAYGFEIFGPKPPKACGSFLTSPEAIDLDVFRNRQLFPLILLLGLTVSAGYEIAQREEELTGLVQDYAAVGFAALAEKLEASTPQEFHVDLTQLLVDAASADSADQV